MTTVPIKTVYQVVMLPVKIAADGNVTVAPYHFECIQTVTAGGDILIMTKLKPGRPPNETA